MLNVISTPEAGFLVHLQGSPSRESGVQAKGPERSEAESLEETIRLMAVKVFASLPKPSAVDFADLLQAGNVGLLQAKRSYNASSGVPLGAYARYRIRGEMLDAVHRASPLGSYPRKGDGDRTVRTIPVETWAEDGTSAQKEPFAEKQVSRQQHRRFLSDALRRLPARGRWVLQLKYGEELTLREIGSKMRVNESRACQIHREALAHLRQSLFRNGIKEPVWRD